VYGKSGYTAQQVLKHILPTITETQTDLIVIGLGANDAFKLNHPVRWNRQIRSLIEQLRNKFPQAPIAFISVPPIKEFPSFTSLLRLTIGNLIELLGAELRLIVNDYPHVFYRGHNLTVKEWCDRFGIENNPAIFFSDGVHPTALTYQLWAQDFAQYLIEKRCINPVGDFKGKQ
ncbi:MAG: SGNH/GDSL hydrolase family protein, partial [Saprospiraceae bacterium]|nr:SGNH/GDSL hydrolase family protein [Saprospiraceae bacterium]